jgi:hypothetical protein
VTFLIGASAVVALIAVLFHWRRTLSVPCRIDLEATHEHFHAHVELAGILPNPGDTVSVADAPSRIPFGERRELTSRAEVQRASFLKRGWTRLVGALRFHELYDVGFE